MCVTHAIGDIAVDNVLREAHIGFKDLGKTIKYYQVKPHPHNVPEFFTRHRFKTKSSLICYAVGKTIADKIVMRCPTLDIYWVVDKLGFCVNKRNQMGFDIVARK